MRTLSRIGFALLVSATSPGTGNGADIIVPARMTVTGTIDARFQSYNVEMVEVTGGRFWKPYAQKDMRRDLYAYRPPVDLSNQRLRRLAAALGPAYMRVSGTWANATFFAAGDGTESAPPAGFNGVLTRAQWRGVVDFARAVDAEIMTSFAVSPGTRGPDGAWTPDQAQGLIDATRALGGRIAAAEFMNEPTLAATNGPPPGYDAKAYGRDFRIFREWIRRAAPETLIVGPGSADDSGSSSSDIRTRDLFAATAPGLDRVSYHHYNTLSARCAVYDDPVQALSEGWLSRTDAALNTSRALRETFEPGKPIWLTETANAACGGNRWDATFLDTFRYLDQLGRLARAGVQVVMHNTLAASDYGLLDEKTFRPRPNYWGALLWRRLMGSTVLDPGVVSTPGLHVYAHCHAATKGAASVLLINTSRHQSRSVTLAVSAERYTLRADQLQGTTVKLNGKRLSLTDDDDLPRLEARALAPGRVRLLPASMTFLVMPDAAACR